MPRPKYLRWPMVRIIGPYEPYVVDMVARSFTSRRFNLTWLTCSYTYVIVENNERTEKYVNVFYHIDTLKSVFLLHQLNKLWSSLAKSGGL